MTKKFVPMPFSPEMMRANLEGRKSQTRRVMNPQPRVGRYGPNHPTKPNGVIGRLPGTWGGGDYHIWYARPDHGVPLLDGSEWAIERFSPRGSTGDVLWFREAACYWTYDDGTIGGDTPVVYGDDEDWESVSRDAKAGKPKCLSSSVGWFKRRPPMHMPAWACRLWAVVKSVRCERLRDITEADAIAEGFKDRAEFLNYISKRNEHRGIAENPWVFVYGYEVTREAPEGWAAYLDQLQAKRVKLRKGAA